MASEMYPYSKKAFLPNLILLLAFAAVILIILLTTPADPILGAGVMILVGLAIMVLGISPYLTDHELREDTLILRQGWYFKAEIPRKNIRAARLSTWGPRKIGISFDVLSPTVRVTTRRHEVIELELHCPQSFIWALGRRADRVVFDTIYAERLLTQLNG